MATPFLGLQHRDEGGAVAIMLGPMNPIDPSTSKAWVKNNPELKPPILIFLFFHKAIRSELEGLHRAAVVFATDDGNIKSLSERYHFLQGIYKHHCNAEDEACMLLFQIGSLSAGGSEEQQRGERMRRKEDEEVLRAGPNDAVWEEFSGLG